MALICRIYSVLRPLEHGRVESSCASGQVWGWQELAPWEVSPQRLHPWKLEQLFPKEQRKLCAQVKQYCFPLAARSVCLLFALLAMAAGVRPWLVALALQSAGRCLVEPHQKQQEHCLFLGAEDAASTGSTLLDRDGGGCKACGDWMGRVAISVRAAESRPLRSWAWFIDANSRCCMSYSIATSQL
jgi:hypothetical protein